MFVKVVDKVNDWSTVFEAVSNREIRYGHTRVEVAEDGNLYAAAWETAVQAMYDAEYTPFGDLAPDEEAGFTPGETVPARYVLFFDREYHPQCVLVPTTRSQWDVYLMNENGKTVERI